MKSNQSHLPSEFRYVRPPRAVEADPKPPFREGDVVEYSAAPGRRFMVAHCYPRTVAGVSRWIVAEVNANTHDADDLRLVTPG